MLLRLHSRPVAVLAILKQSKSRSPIRSRRPLLGDLPIEEAYVYAEPGFEGFGEIKRRFPSAEIFTLTVQTENLAFDGVRELMGKVNASDFEGRAAETVLFISPEGSSTRPRAKFVFVFRPEGWNTFYRRDTQSWEKVVHELTGKPVYETADFGPLSALKVADADN